MNAYLAADTPYRFLSAIEARAETMLASYQQLHGQIPQPPVPDERLIEVHLDLAILWDEIPPQDHAPILGFIRPESRMIVLNQAMLHHFEQYLGTEAFTLAHEVGHWDLHIVKSGPDQLSLGLCSSHPFICRMKTSDRREFQANRYAAALLMPEALIRSTVAGLDLALWPTLYDLKDAFGVTITALTTRLRQLSLIHHIRHTRIYLSPHDYQIHRGQLELV